MKYQRSKQRKTWYDRIADGQNARAAEYGAEGSFTGAEYEHLCKLCGGCCVMCGKVEIVLSADHIMPLAEGGTNYIWNIQPLCRNCNSSKQISTADYRPEAVRRFYTQSHHVDRAIEYGDSVTLDAETWKQICAAAFCPPSISPNALINRVRLLQVRLSEAHKLLTEHGLEDAWTKARTTDAGSFARLGIVTSDLPG